MLGWFAFAVAVAYWPGIPEAVVTAKWAVISAAPVMLFWLTPRWSIVHTLALVFLAWAGITGAWTPVETDAADAMFKLTLGFLLFVIGFETRSLDTFYKCLAIGLIPSTVVAVAQAAGYVPLDGGMEAPSGLFGNSNVMGELAALVIIGLAAQASWGFVGLTAVPLLLAQARCAFLAVILTGLFASRFATGVLLVCMAALLVLPMHRDLPSIHSMGERFSIWRDAASELTAEGQGIGSFQTVMQARSDSTHRVVQHAHNDAIELAVELGPLGCILALVLAALVMSRAEGSDRLVLAALGIEAMFGFPLHMPGTVFVGAVVAGHAARGWAGVHLGEPVGGQALQHRDA